MRRFAPALALIALATVDNSEADSQSFTLSTGYNETALTSELTRGTAFQGQVAQGHMLYRGSLDSRGMVSFGVGRIFSSSDIETRGSRYPVLTVFACPGEPSGVALDLHQDWYVRGEPTKTPDQHVTMFQTQGGVVFQDGRSPKVRVTHRFVTSDRRLPARTQGVEWVWEFRRDFPAVYSRVSGQSEMNPVTRRNMRLENWIFFSREVGFAVMRLNLGATYKTVPNDASDQTTGTTTVTDPNGNGSGYKRVPVLMFRVAMEVKRW